MGEIETQSISNANHESSVLLELLNNINLNDASVPQRAVVLMNCFKVTLIELKCLKDIVQRVNQLEDFKTVCENTTARLQAENI